ncbi:DUF1269 domain-containing protein [Rudaea sp.]|uniref:DUF1269 domain-containing protein n=1 Tax=Rudaea sp. TaxID=2136325 RepID=UPI0032205C2F
MTIRTIVAVFPNSNSAYTAASAIRALRSSGKIDFSLKAGAMFRKDEKGNVIPLEEKERPLWGTLAGGVAGALIGFLAGPAGAATGAAAGATSGLVADAVGASLDVDFAENVATWVRPGETAVVVEANEGNTRPVDDAVRLNGGRVYRSDS